ncbi:EAL domain-containing protein [Aliiglaciecola sp. LCG003]|uniref:putative bifunctional diguanylate cyclase/phosphodiesterase n=1 Tax=Aliiglaciecola sp. LCG003 TaxID=3053655 RepID=UPI002572F07C|nr:EAL domain-containing protein [Aliiglaciecola sp. LCG003]WJG10897.1 EAL domain-containing protein [Aliiglaciecola sp. LCG003]
MSISPELSQLKFAYQHFPDAIAVFDLAGHYLFANLAFEQQINAQIPVTVEGPISRWLALSGEQTMDWIDVLHQAKNQLWQGQASMSDKHSHSLHTTLTLHSLDQQFLVGKFELKQAETCTKALTQLAYKDTLTGLANRSLFNQLFDYEISQAQRLELRFAVLFIDLDRFKRINDNLGHDAGDALLLTVAERLQKTLRKSDVVARLGGDEFVVIMNNIKDSETIATVTEKLIREIKKPVKSGANIMDVGCSVGISVYPDNGKTAEELLQHADAAMYRAKHQGGNDYYYFSDSLNQELQDIRLIEKQLETGLREHQFVPYFQPVIDMRNNRLMGIECLARWCHPQRGILSAIEFIPVASKIGLIQDIFNQILKQAFSSLQQWRVKLNLSVPLSLNISSKQFYHQQTFDEIEQLMHSNQLSTDAVRIEITESTLQEQGPELLKQLDRIQLAGFSITLDDFGTGYSSLRYLQQLPVDIIKIDRSFVRNIDNSPHDKVIVKAIIQLAETLGIATVAEGVETHKQAAYLSENNCHIMQGYLFSPAVAAKQFEEYLVANKIIVN